MNRNNRLPNYAAKSLAIREDSVAGVARKVLLKTNSATLGTITRGLGFLLSKITGRRLPLVLRAMVSLSQSIDPLKKYKKLPDIELVVPFVEKDLRTLAMVLSQAELMVRNPIRRIVLITPRMKSIPEPRFEVGESREILDSILLDHPNSVLKFDQDILGTPLLDELKSRFGKGDRNSGWVTQQLIKFSAAMIAESRASLIIDADTLLLTRKTWLTANGKQLLQISNEYHHSFMRHLKQFFNLEKRLRVSFITHHQLMQKDVVRQMFPEGAKSLLSWWRSSTEPTGRDLGDYEAYGTYLVECHAKRVAFGSFGNLLSPFWARFSRDLEQTGLSPTELIPSYCSVSFHSWAQQDWPG